MIQQFTGASEAGGFNEGEAADRFGGIEATAHQLLQGLPWLLKLIRNHCNHLLKAAAQGWLCQIGLGLFQAVDAVALGRGRATQRL